jgi:hypothetical protein
MLYRQMAIAGLTKLCPPAELYLVFSGLAIIVMLFQNYNGVNVYCLGSYSCSVTSVGAIFLMKIVYVLFWTWILNLICRAGATSFAWFLVLFPLLLFFILIAIIFVPM